MKNLFIISIFVAMANLANSQNKVVVGLNVADSVEINCDNSSLKVSDVTGSGKSLLVVASGYDCSICRSEAPGIASFANENSETVVVWGAMHNRFSNNTPTCSMLTSWKTQYSWNNIFMFNDINHPTIKFWAEGYTWYTVVNPDNEVIYSGGNQSTAYQKAKEVSRVTGLINREDAFQYFHFWENQFVLAPEVNAISVIDMTGKTVLSIQESTSEVTAILPTGMYVVQLQVADAIIRSKIFAP